MNLEEIKDFINEHFKEIDQSSVYMNEYGNIDVEVFSPNLTLHLIFDYQSEWKHSGVMSDDDGYPTYSTGGGYTYTLWDLMEIQTYEGNIIELGNDHEEVTKLALEKASSCGFDFDEFIHNELN